MAKRGNGEGSIYRRNDGRWVGEMTIEGRKRKFVYGKTRKEVQEKLQTALQELQQGIVMTGTARQTLEQFLTDWLENSQKQSVRARTYERYEEIVRLHIAPVLGRHRLQKLSAQHVQAFGLAGNMAFIAPGWRLGSCWWLWGPRWLPLG